MTTDTDRLRSFAKEVLEFSGGPSAMGLVDEELQFAAERHGLFEAVERTEFCGGKNDCDCWHEIDPEKESPWICYRKTKVLEGVMSDDVNELRNILNHYREELREEVACRYRIEAERDALAEALDWFDDIASFAVSAGMFPDSPSITNLRSYIQRVVPEGKWGEHTPDVLYDSAWIAGATFGWNCGVSENSDRFNRAVNARINDRGFNRSSPTGGRG